MPATPLLDAGTLRRLAVEYEVDPRTILKLMRGAPVRGMARDRAVRALESLGLQIVSQNGPSGESR